LAATLERWAFQAHQGEEAVPRIKSSKKRMRQSRAAREHNRTQRSQLRSAVRQARSADGDTTAALATASSLLDRAGRKRLIHPNAAARQKSRLAKAMKKA
jgi:small subunit ribosomal protein S20